MTTLVEPVPVPDDSPLHLDSWYNALNGMAQAARDKREADKACIQSISYDTCLAVYQSSWLAARIVDKPADEMTREGFDVIVQDQDDAGDECADYLEELDLGCITEQALKWQRLFGGALVLIGVNDGETDLSQPVNVANLKSIDYLNVFDASEARPVTWQDNPAAEGYGEPLMWKIEPTVIGQEVPRKDGDKAGGVSGRLFVPAMQMVHASRVYAFPGVQVSRRHVMMGGNPGIQRGWGDGVLARCIKLIRDFEGSWDGISYQLREFSQAIYGIKDLAQTLLSDKGGTDSYIQRRMRTIEMSRSLIRAVMLDKDGETFQRSDATFTGVADTAREFASILAAAADMPVSILLGAQGGGLGASGSGQNDIQNWYAATKGRQMKVLKPFLMYLLKLVCLAADGPKGVKKVKDRKDQDAVEGIKVDFRPLYQMTDTEMVDLYVKLATADEKYLNMGALTALDIGKARMSGKRLKVFPVADLDELETREEMTSEMAQTQHETTVKNLEKHGQETPPPPAKPGPGKKV